MATIPTLTWKCFEPQQTKLGRNSLFKGADWKNELDHYANAINFLMTRTGGIDESIATITALRAIPDEASYSTGSPTPRRNGMEVFVEDVQDGASHSTHGTYRFDASSSATDNDAGNVDTDGVVSPDSGTGRWIRVGASDMLRTRGREATHRTLYDNLVVDLNTDTVVDDIALKFVGRSAATETIFDSDKPVHLKTGGSFQDLKVEDMLVNNDLDVDGIADILGATDIHDVLTVDDNILGSGEHNKFQGTVDQTAAAAKALVQVGGDFTNGDANGNMQVINAPSGFAGYVFATAVDDVIKNIFHPDGTVTGTDADADTKFVTRGQMNSAIADSKDALYGDGSDGDGTFDGVATVFGLVPSANVYTMTQDIHADDLAVNSPAVIITNGYKIYVNGTFSGDGTIRFNGADGSAGGNASGTTPGAAGAGTSTVNGSIPGHLDGGAGGIGGTFGSAPDDGVTGAAGTTINGQGNQGGAGGVVVGGEDPGDGGANTASKTLMRDFVTASLYRDFSQTTPAQIYPTTGNGGGGGGRASIGANDSAGGGGGGAGTSGGNIFICAADITFTGTVEALGGNGGNGGNASQPSTSGDTGGGGGGAGGDGGLIIIIYGASTEAYSTNVTGGTAGTGGLGYNTGGLDPDNDGDDGTAGGAGSVIKIRTLA